MKKRWIARVLLCILLLSLSFSAVSCANEDEAKVLKEAEALLDAAFTVNEIYLGSGIATYGFAALFENFGWNTTIWVWVVLLAIANVLLFATLPMWKRFLKNHYDN